MLRIAISDKVIGRLSLYRRILERRIPKSHMDDHIFSHELAALCGGTGALVRRDLMTIGFSGNPKKGYRVKELLNWIGNYLNAPEEERNVALAGVGNLGRALLAHFTYRRPKLPIVAAFDTDAQLLNRVIQGCRCFSVQQMDQVVGQFNIRVGIIAVPAAAAQDVTDRMVNAGITGLLNFAPVSLRVPADVFVENIDMTMSLEKVAFFARLNVKEKEVAR
ncbi:redox-sensing transcriptional repressor Rex [bacterium]|nr:redox-sensing transcriptional repressor Rex [bacterium]